MHSHSSDLFALWRDKQRAQCLRCEHCDTKVMKAGNIVMRCEKMPIVAAHELHGYCIDARDPGGICGTRAALFKPR